MHVMAERGMNTADKRLLKIAGKRFGACLRHYRVKGLIRSVTGWETGARGRWCAKLAADYEFLRSFR
jgi:hypothetical protein